MQQKFKLVSGYETYFKIDESGNMVSMRNGILKKWHLDRHGYATYNLPYKNGKKFKMRVHTLVAQTFIPNPENKPQVNHKDGVKTNNHVLNLEWVTCKENVNHAIKLGLNKPRPKKFNSEQIVFIKENVNEMGLAALAKMFSVSKTSIYNAYANRDTYRNGEPIIYMGTRKKVINKETGEIYESPDKVAELLGVNIKWITRRLAGERANKTPFKYLIKKS